MGLIDRYICRTTFGAFLLVLVSLTSIIWVTQALRDIDLLTNQGQTILTFVGITGMIVPLLVLVIAPIAVMIAVAYVLNRLSADSELIVMNASGMSPWRLFRPFLLVAVVVALLVAFISAYLAPQGLRQLRDWLSEVRADVVTYIVKPGQFTTIEKGLTFYIRERRISGQLLGIFLDDRRDPMEHVTVLAEEGEILKNDRGMFLLLQNGSVQRHEQSQRDPSIVVFDRYAFDLSRFSGTPVVSYTVRERYLWQLINPSPDDTLAKTQAGHFRAELHDRLLAPFYPIAFVIITYAFLGAPRTTRQSRGLSLVAAIGLVASLRLVGFASAVIGVHVPPVLAVQYVALIAAIGLGILAIGRGVIIEPPAFVTQLATILSERIAKRAGMLAAAR
ncbi:MAG: LPS export ABC transporter permease LptF [Rhizobiales bacterium]|nr:LPS export ABC transporter permease LptF [Hyphomicrobiales bacterium]